MIHFNRPLVPGADDLQPYLDRILSSRVLTNTGPVHDELEEAVCQYLGVKYITLVSSGTLALALALKALNLKGEVITTPFTAPATLQAIHWNNLVPVFADIDPADLNLSPESIEKATTSDTCAILPVHIFGHPCKVEAIQQIAERHHLKVIYDAAHCFGVKLNGEPVSKHGDLSVLSFHATKVFNTIEGGAVVSHDENTKKYLDALKNTGVNDNFKLTGYGLNAKMNELQAAFGLAQMKYLDEAIRGRRAATLLYRKAFQKVKGLRLLDESKDVVHNYAYFPILINPEEYGMSRDQLADDLLDQGIITKKYFYPLMSDFAEFSRYKRGPLFNAEQVACNILCLPLYHDFEEQDVLAVINRVSNPRVGNL